MTLLALPVLIARMLLRLTTKLRLLFWRAFKVNRSNRFRCFQWALLRKYENSIPAVVVVNKTNLVRIFRSSVQTFLPIEVINLDRFFLVLLRTVVQFLF